MKDRIPRGKLRHTWVSEFVKRRFSIFSRPWEIWKLPLKKLTVLIIKSWKRKFRENWSEYIKSSLFSSKIREISIKLFSSSRDASLLLKNLKIRTKKLSAVKKSELSTKS